MLIDTRTTKSTTYIRKGFFFLVILLIVIAKLTSDDGGMMVTIMVMFGVVDVGNCMFTISFKRIVVVKCDDYSNFFN